MQIEMRAADLGGPDEDPSELMRQGWLYRDLPRVTPAVFDQFIEIAGSDNLKWLTLANYGETKRGQVLINPEGQKRLKEYAAKNSN